MLTTRIAALARFATFVRSLVLTSVATLAPANAVAAPEIWLYGDVWVHSEANSNGDVTIYANASGYTNDYTAPLDVELYFLNPGAQTLGYVIVSGYGEAHATTQYLLNDASEEGEYRYLDERPATRVLRLSHGLSAQIQSLPIPVRVSCQLRRDGALCVPAGMRI